MHANSYASRNTKESISMTKFILDRESSETDTINLISNLANKQIVIRNLTFFIAMIYMDRIADQVPPGIILPAS